jgi:Domain of unknown function (DUF4214)
MRTWLRCLRPTPVKPALTWRTHSSRPAVEKLEDRTVLQGGLTPNQAFVTALYHDLLNRAPDPAGLAAWTNVLNVRLANNTQVALSFINSLEYRTDAVQNLYHTLLRRDADAGGLNAFVNYLAAGGTIKQVEIIMLSSDEYFQTQGGDTNTGFLQAVYRDVLNRPPDAAGLQAFSQALNAGLSRRQVAEVILDSPEGTTVLVTNMYQKFLNRNPDPTGLNSFVAAIEENDSATSPNMFPNADPAGDPTDTSGSASAQRNVSGSASAQRNVAPAGIGVKLAAGTVINTGVTVPAGATAITVPGVTLPPGTVLVELPGQTLPAGATTLTGVTVPTGAVTLTLPGVTLPAGTVAVPLAGATLPNGQVIGGATVTTTSGSPSAQRNVSGSASAQRNTETLGANVTLAAGTTITSGVTVPAGAQAISIPGTDLGPGVVTVLLPGQTLPAGATVLNGLVIPTGAPTLTIPGVTLPTGVVAVPIGGVTLATGQTFGLTDPPVSMGVSVEQAMAAMLGSGEFLSLAIAQNTSA